MKEETLDICANRWGVTREELVRLEEDAWAELQRWLDGKKKQETRVEKRGAGELRWSNGAGTDLDLPADLETTVGGNAWNSYQAVRKVLEALAPEKQSNLRFHRAPELPGVSRERISYVVTGSKEEMGPQYWSEDPYPVETGPLPDGEQVFVSSGGPDLYDSISDWRTRNPQGRLIVAPGSRQVERGIPRGILGKVDFLSCNDREAMRLVSHLREPTLNWEFIRGELVRVLSNVGKQEVRVTFGEQGVWAGSRGQTLWVRSVDREEVLIQDMVGQLSERGIATEATKRNAEVNGCGDTRLGAELALEMVGIRDLRDRLKMASVLATLHTFNPKPSITTFPNDVIHNAVRLTSPLLR